MSTNMGRSFKKYIGWFPQTWRLLPINNAVRHNTGAIDKVKHVRDLLCIAQKGFRIWGYRVWTRLYILWAIRRRSRTCWILSIALVLCLTALLMGNSHHMFGGITWYHILKMIFRCLLTSDSLKLVIRNKKNVSKIYFSFLLTREMQPKMTSHIISHFAKQAHSDGPNSPPPPSIYFFFAYFFPSLHILIMYWHNFPPFSKKIQKQKLSPLPDLSIHHSFTPEIQQAVGMRGRREGLFRKLLHPYLCKWGIERGRSLFKVISCHHQMLSVRQKSLMALATSPHPRFSQSQNCAWNESYRMCVDIYAVCTPFDQTVCWGKNGWKDEGVTIVLRMDQVGKRCRYKRLSSRCVNRVN